MSAAAKCDTTAVLPIELMVAVHQFLPLQDLLSCRRVSRRWREIASADAVWLLRVQLFKSWCYRSSSRDDRENLTYPTDKFPEFPAMSRFIAEVGISRNWIGGRWRDRKPESLQTEIKTLNSIRALVQGAHVFSVGFNRNVHGMTGKVCITDLPNTTAAAIHSEMEPTKTINTNAPIVSIVQASADIIWTGDTQGNLDAWDLEDASRISIHTESHQEGGVVALHCDGHSFAISGSMDGIVHIWKLSDSGKNANCILTASHDGMVVCVRVQENLTDYTDTILAASGSNDHTAAVYDISSKTCLFRLVGHQDCVSTLIFFNRYPKKMLVTGSDDTTIRLWQIDDSTNKHPKMNPQGLSPQTDAATLDYVDTLSTSSVLDLYHEDYIVALRHHGPAPKLISSPTDLDEASLKEKSLHVLISASYDGLIVIWDVDNLVSLRVFKDMVGSVISSMPIARGRFLLLTSESTNSDNFMMLDLNTYSVVQRHQTGRAIYSCASDDRRIVTTTTNSVVVVEYKDFWTT